MRKLLITSLFVAVGFPNSLLAAEPSPYDIKKPGDAQSPTAGQQPPATAQQPPTVDSLVARLLDLEKQLQNLKVENAALSEQVNKLAGQKEELNTRVAELSKRLEQIATKDGEYWVPNVRAAMEKSTAFQKDLFDVTTAMVEIDNQTGQVVEVFLNGTRWRLPAGTNRMNVPYGPVRLEFVTAQGDRDPWIYSKRDWKLEGHQAQLKLHIVSGQARPF